VFPLNAPDRAARLSSAARRVILPLSLALVLEGCGGPGIIQSATETLRLAWSGAPDVPLTREKVDALPYASIRARFGKGPRSFLVLGRYAGEELHWVSADRAVIATRHGRVVRTVGFGTDLRETRDVNPDPVATGLQHVTAGAEHLRLVDIRPGDHFQVPVHSAFTPEGLTTVEILGNRYDLLQVREQNRADGLDWTFDNLYWVDAATGFVWRSLQHFAPGLPPVEIEILKEAA